MNIDLLSIKETEIFFYLADGMTIGEIAVKENRSVKTIESHVCKIREKLKIPSLHKLIVGAIKWKHVEECRE